MEESTPSPANDDSARGEEMSPEVAASNVISKAAASLFLPGLEERLRLLREKISMRQRRKRFKRTLSLGLSRRWAFSRGATPQNSCAGSGADTPRAVSAEPVRSRSYISKPVQPHCFKRKLFKQMLDAELDDYWKCIGRKTRGGKKDAA